METSAKGLLSHFTERGPNAEIACYLNALRLTLNTTRKILLPQSIILIKGILLRIRSD